MVPNELERVTVEYLTRTLVQAVKPQKPAVPGPPVVVAMPGIGDVNIYKGEANLDLKLPAVIAICNATEPDNETGNVMCQLVVAVRVQVDPEVVHPKPLEDLNTLSTLVFDAMLAADLKDKLNTTAGPRFTAIATVQRSPVKNETDRNAGHFMNCTMYCSGRNLLGT